MFRQVVMQRWLDETDDETKSAFVRELQGLHRIPAVTSLLAGVDGRFFADNWGVVTVLDFPSFAAARDYVAHPDHQAFIRNFAAPLTAQRAVVQYEWGEGSVVGYHHIKVPVRDVGRSRQWYTSVLDFETDLEFVENGELKGVALRHPVAAIRLALRQDPDRAAALAGFDGTALAVGTRDDLQVMAERAKRAGSSPGPIEEGQEGWTCDLSDPDGLVVRLYTHERHLPPGS